MSDEESSSNNNIITSNNINNTTTTSSSTTNNNANPADEAIFIKREPVDESDIKDYAETTMNELLGWYGYGKVDSRDTQGLNLHRFTTPGSPPTVDTNDDGSRDRTPPDGHPSNSNNGNGKTPTDPPNLPSGYVVCAWCQKVGMKLFTLKTSSGQKAFCSELCFTQCRRASFKKNKVCDWCKHIRHTVNYVDFQDGEQQLQFCSDKCLNQYKMNIFCKETQAHLQMHPHLQDAAKLAAASGGTGAAGVTLITPDLWLRDCHGTHESTSGTPSGINGHEGKPDPPVAVSTSSSVVMKSEEGTSPAATTTSALLLSSKSKRSKEFLYRHSRMRDRGKHKRHRPSKNGAILNTMHSSHCDHTDGGTPLTSPKSSASSTNGGGGSSGLPGQASSLGSGQPSPNVPMQVLTTSPIPGVIGAGPPPISPHGGIPPQVLAAAAAAAAVAANAHPHPGMMNHGGDMPRPPFMPPFLPPYPFLTQPPDMLRMPPAGLRPGQPPMLFPPGLGLPLGPQPPPSQNNPNPPQNPLLNPLISSLLPPVAVLVPYPVVLPIPIPIPIPIPFPISGDKNFGKKPTESPTPPVSSAASTPSTINFMNRDAVGRPKNSTIHNMTTTTTTASSFHSAGNRHSRHMSNNNPAKRVDSVITRLVAPKLAQANLMGKGNHCSAFSCGMSGSGFPGDESTANHDAATILAAALEEGRVPSSASPGSWRMPIGTSALSTAVTSAASTSSVSFQRSRPIIASAAALDSSSDQSNRLDDSSDISDFPDSDDLDLADMESDDSRQSDSRLLMTAASTTSNRNFAGIGDSTSAPSLPTLASPLNFHSRERSKEPIGVDESVSRQVDTSLDPSEPELKRKCMQTRLTAK